MAARIAAQHGANGSMLVVVALPTVTELPHPQKVLKAT
jgi:hypothetical protein